MHDLSDAYMFTNLVQVVAIWNSLLVIGTDSSPGMTSGMIHIRLVL